jgi:hypothetical protein
VWGVSDVNAAYFPRWERNSDLLRTQLQETGIIRLSFLTLLDLTSVVSDLGIDPAHVEFKNGYAVVRP